MTLKLVKINSDIDVSPTAVAAVSVVIDSYHNHKDYVVIRLIDGTEYHVKAEYGRTIWQTKDVIVAKLTNAN